MVKKVQSSCRAFSLMELLTVVAIMGLLTLAALPAMSRSQAGSGVARGASDLSGALEMARVNAMALNTYVWVGVKTVAANDPQNADKTDKVLLVTMAAKNGRESDLESGELIPLVKPAQLQRVKLQKFGDTILSDSGRELDGVDDISEASLSPGFQYSGATAKGSYTQLVQFDPSGGVRIKTSLSRVIEIGIQPSLVADSKNIAIIQINGLTGQIRTFRP
jgi:prepilin-type N-terminal cleavage/methylation domain-containing protein